MKRWLAIFFLAAVLVGCERFQPARTPTPARTAVPTSVPAPTETASLTPLPPIATLAATDTPALTDTPGATETEAATDTPTGTPTATVTNTPVRARPAPKATATNTVIALKYAAPALIEPKAGDTRIEGKDDLLFRWTPVADLGSGECYLLTLQVINLADPVQHYGQDSFVAQNTCNSAISSGIVEFTLRKKNPPSYAGLVAISTQSVASNQFRARWWVTVVLDRGPDPQNPGKELSTPLSPPSTQNEFNLFSP